MFEILKKDLRKLNLKKRFKKKIFFSDFKKDFPKKNLNLMSELRFLKKESYSFERNKNSEKDFIFFLRKKIFKKDSFFKIWFRPHEKRITEKRIFCRPLIIMTKTRTIRLKLSELVHQRKRNRRNEWKEWKWRFKIWNSPTMVRNKIWSATWRHHVTSSRDIINRAPFISNAVYFKM